MIKRTDLFWWTGLILGFLITRLVNLGLLPIFTDEAIYLRWSQIMVTDASLRFLPLVDGKPPLFMWLTSLVMKLLPQMDPLLTGRLVSVGAGLGSLVGIFVASYLLFKNKKLSYLAAIFYLFTPFTFFYDRFALADSLLATFGIGSFVLGILLVKTLRLDVAMIAGFVSGLGLLTKSPAQFFLYLSPILMLLFDFKNKNWKINLAKLIGLFLVAVVISQAIFSVLRLFPLFNMIGQKNLEFIIPLSDFFKNPLALFWGNIKSLVYWQYFYLTPLLSLTVFAGMIIGPKYYWKQTIILIGYYLIFLITMASFNKVIYPRYLLTFTPMLLILASLALSQIKKISLIFLISLIILIYPAYTDFKLLTDPVNAPLLQADRDQYIDGWPAGFGVKEIRSYLSQVTNHQVLATEGTFGLMPYSLELYQKDYPNVEIKSYWPLPTMSPAGTTLLLMYQNQIPPGGWKLEEIVRFRQGLGKDYLRLYRVSL